MSDQEPKPSDELASMPPCPVCGGRCAWKEFDDEVREISTFVKPKKNYDGCFCCENLCKQADGSIGQRHSEWLALDRSKMPKKTAVVWVKPDNGMTYCNTGTRAIVDISNPKMSGDFVCRFGEYWCYASSIEEAYQHIEAFRLDKPTPERPHQTWTQSDPVADCKPEVDPLEDIKYSVCEKGKNVVSQALSFIDGDRKQQYGDYSKNAQLIADAWSAMLGIHVPVELVPAMFVAVKIIRMQRETDNEVDGMGYLIHQARMIMANNKEDGDA